MRIPPAILALAAAAAPAHGRRHTVLRRAQGNSEDAGGNPASAGGELNVVTGSGVEEADIPPEDADTLAIPTYTDEQCDQWLAGAFAADADGSNGLSESEFHAFLSGIDDPPYVAAYFRQFESYVALPWLFHVVHKSLACKCEDLGLGAECCEGDDAEVSFVGLREEDSQQTRGGEYRHDACNLIAVVFQKAIETPAPTKQPTPALELAPAGPESGIAFECVSAKCEGEPSLEPESGWNHLGACGQYTDVGECPLAHDEDADYAMGDQVTMRPEDVPTKKMRFYIPGSVIDYSSFDYSVLLDEDATNDMEGVPDYLDAEAVLTNEDNNGVLQEVVVAFGMLATDLLGGMATGDDVTSEGKKLRGRQLQQLPTMGSVDPVEVLDIPCPAGLKYAPADVPCLNFIIKIIPSGAMANDKALRESFEDTLNYVINQDGKLYDTVYEANPDTVVMGLGNPGNGIDYQAEVDSSRSADSEQEPSGLSTGAIVGIILLVLLVPIVLLAMYARYRKAKEQERLRRLEEMRKHNDLETDSQDLPPGGEDVEDPLPAVEPPMEAEPDDDEESSAPSEWSESVSDSEITDGQVSFAEEGAAPAVTAGSALAAMGAAGVAASLAPEKSGKNWDDSDGKAEVRAEVRQLVEETNAPRSADELLTVYDGKEEVLLSHLRTMKDKQGDSTAVVAPLMGPDKAPPSNIDEELLSKLETQKDPTKAAAVAAAAESAESDFKRKVSTDSTIDKELLSKMEKKKEAEDKAPSGVNSDFVAFMNASANFQKKSEDPKAKIRTEVTELVEVTKPGKSADQLLKAYSGREEELLRNLRKLKASKKEIV